MTDEEMFSIMSGMDEVNRQMMRQIEERAPLCHFRKMFLNNFHLADEEETWWECSVCGHTKDV